MVHKAIERITQMEQCFDTLQKAAEENPSAVLEDASLKELMNTLTQYYESGLWLKDYELDENGLLPRGLKRGVLSQDAVYNFLARISEAK